MSGGNPQGAGEVSPVRWLRTRRAVRLGRTRWPVCALTALALAVELAGCSAKTPHLLVTDAGNGGVSGNVDVVMSALVRTDAAATIVSVSAIADSGLTVRVPGSCVGGCPGGPFPWPDDQVKIRPFPLRLQPFPGGAELLLVAHIDDQGRAVLARGACLYIRALRVRLSSGRTVTATYPPSQGHVPYVGALSAMSVNSSIC